MRRRDESSPVSGGETAHGEWHSPDDRRAGEDRRRRPESAIPVAGAKTRGEAQVAALVARS